MRYAESFSAGVAAADEPFPPSIGAVFLLGGVMFLFDRAMYVTFSHFFFLRRSARRRTHTDFFSVGLRWET